MSEFQKVFESRATIQLLRIINTPEDYSTAAIEAAKTELEGRTDKSEAHEMFDIEKANNSKRKAKTAKIEKAIEEKANSAIELLNPVQAGDLSSQKRLLWLVILFAGITIYQIATEFSFLLYMLTEAGEWDLSSVLYFLPFIILPVGTYLLCQKNKNGWGLLYAWSIVNCFGSFRAAWAMWDYEPSGIPALDWMMPQTSSAQLIFSGLAVGAVIAALLMKQIREILNLDKQTILIWSAIGLALPIISLFL